MFEWVPVSVAARLMLLTPQHTLVLVKKKKLVGDLRSWPALVSRESLEKLIGPVTDAQIKLARKYLGE